MPNWCENQLVITEPMSDELRAYLKENGFSFAKIAPPDYPAEEDDQNFGIIDAQVEAWGTKWDIPVEEESEISQGLLDGDLVGFDTAWSPPCEAIRRLSDKFPTDHFRLLYSEPGMMFCGESNFHDGIEDETVFIQDSAEEFKKFITEEMGFEPWDDEDEDEEEEEEVPESEDPK